MTKRKARVIRTRVAGEGADGGLYGVVSLEGGPKGEGGYRKKVCPTCPWRKDSEVGRFPAEAYRQSAATAYDGAFNTFGCHESGREAPQTCAGFLQANSANNNGVRIAMAMGNYDPRKQQPTAELYGSYKDMAVANGVDPDDPVLEDCRGDDEEALFFRRQRK